jgi:tRNA threonylcarbamoyl adenosine modification protein YjeE
MSPHYTVDNYLKTLPTWKQDLIGLVVDVGTLPRNKPSTVIDMTSDDVKILRQGDQKPQMNLIYTSNSQQETSTLARKLIERYDSSTSKRPLVILLEGEVGAGKTVFVKGAALHFGIDNVISPTFVVYYDYPFGDGRVLVHADLYNVHEPEEFEHLGLEEYLREGTVMFIEWSDRSGPIYDLMCEKARIVNIKIEHVNEHTRTILIDESKM